MNAKWMLSAALLVIPATLVFSTSAEAKSHKKSSAKKAKKLPKKISINFDGDKSRGRGPAAIAPVEPVLEKAESLAMSSASNTCEESSGSSGWHLPVTEDAYSCTLSGRNKASDPSRGLGFVVNKKIKISSMTEGEVIGVVGELMGCKVIVKPSRCPAGSKDCNITYTIPNLTKNDQNECLIPGIKVGTQLKACQKIAEVRPSKSFNLVRVETSGKAPLQDMFSSYKKASKERKQCSRDKTLMASSI